MSVYRIDTFTLPDEARTEFVAASIRTIELLRRQPGFRGDRWFEKVAGRGEVNVVTMVEWRDGASVDAAGRAVQAMQAEHEFDAASFVARHGIRANKAVFEARDIPEHDR